ncbi:tetratricopeptide repeat protein [Uliginosibacterium gangwonense]|uniref:tetratricopeptide repeat protein n=1 Tax=Uliginosibacterium gangwonense TaxID=392736 RepID=UPI00036A562E|nr:tetratricopeptide repeat protein [Uliginosibacterium gangwonense]
MKRIELLLPLVMLMALPHIVQAEEKLAAPACAPLKPAVPKAKKIHRVKHGLKSPLASKHPVVEDVTSYSPFEQALRMLKLGRVAEARALLRTQLRLDPAHLDARRLLVQLLLDAGFKSDAEALLKQGQDLSPQSLDIARALALLQAERGAVVDALDTLENSRPYAKETDGEYLAFMAGLCQQAGQHERANGLLEQALVTSPGNGAWLYAQWVSRRALGDRLGARGSAEAALTSGQVSKEQARLMQAALRHDAQDTSDDEVTP